MAINYIPNDPEADGLGIQTISPQPDRNEGQARFETTGSFPEGQHALESDEFLFWQCREAAYRALNLWEKIDGPLTQWQNGTSILKLNHKVLNQNTLNAFYDRSGLSFFEHTNNGKITRTGISMDVVAHEAGHAFLDYIRPELFNPVFGEDSAFHESFGDCIAILTALDDQATRDFFIQNRRLDQPNFIENWGEHLAAGIAAVVPSHNGAVPRLALNQLQWAIPASLPIEGGPGVLINEAHSYARIFTGCFYDTIQNIYNQGADKTADGLHMAALTAGRLLAIGARSAPHQARFYQSVGNAMLLADQEQNGGANINSIKSAFGAHNITLTGAQMMAAGNMLAGRAPRTAVGSVSDVITQASRRDLLSAMGASMEGQRFTLSSVKFSSEKITVLKHQQKVPLDDVAEVLAGVVVMASEDVLVGEEQGRAAAFGHVPNVVSSRKEIESQVRSLYKHGQIDLDRPKKSDFGKGTHSIRKVGSERVLQRHSFNCGCRRTVPLMENNEN